MSKRRYSVTRIEMAEVLLNAIERVYFLQQKLDVNPAEHLLHTATQADPPINLLRADLEMIPLGDKNPDVWRRPMWFGTAIAFYLNCIRGLLRQERDAVDVEMQHLRETITALMPGDAGRVE